MNITIINSKKATDYYDKEEAVAITFYNVSEGEFQMLRGISARQKFTMIIEMEDI